MKKLACLLAAALLLSGCANRQANPVQLYNNGDEKKSCPHLKAEIIELRADIKRKTGDDANTTGANVALGVVGVFLIVPWLLMDLSDADEIELEAMVRRHNALRRIAVDKQCPFVASHQEIKLGEPEKEPVADPDAPASWGD